MLATLEAPAAIVADADALDLARTESYREFIATSIRKGSGYFRHHVRAGGRLVPRRCTLPLPGLDSGLSPLAIDLIRRSYDYALDGLLYPVEEYAGPLPSVQPGDVFAQAGQLLDEGLATPAAVLKATRHTLKFFKLG